MNSGLGARDTAGAPRCVLNETLQPVQLEVSAEDGARAGLGWARLTCSRVRFHQNPLGPEGPRAVPAAGQLLSAPQGYALQPGPCKPTAARSPLARLGPRPRRPPPASRGLAPVRSNA